jgi:hypothetical protein
VQREAFTEEDADATPPQFPAKRLANLSFRAAKA